MKSIAPALMLLCLASPLQTLGHDIPVSAPVIIDTDLGLDDAVTLAIALQYPGLRIEAIVASVGVADAESGTRHLERLLHRFNRSDIRIVAPAMSRNMPFPPFRSFAQAVLETALPVETPARHEPFAPEVYISKRAKSIVLALGPLTNVAAALTARPDLANHLDTLIVAGESTGWNCTYDKAALDTVLASKIKVAFASPGRYGHKPGRWRDGGLAGERPTSVGALFLRDLFAQGEAGGHYVKQLEHLHDELALMYLVNHSAFIDVTDSPYPVFAPIDDFAPVTWIENSLRHGRQQKNRVVFEDGLFPESILRPDIRKRRDRIIAASGPDEWFAQLQMNELHDHLGAYSIIGVKMGLRAAELLNAPPHSMRVTSYAPLRPPVSCINDGLIVSTGATPGRTLFAAEPSDDWPLRAAFEYNGRRITLALKQEYAERIRAEIKTLLAAHSLDNPEYWTGVRRFGLEIWEKWHRTDLFTVVPAQDESKTPHTQSAEPH